MILVRLLGHPVTSFCVWLLLLCIAGQPCAWAMQQTADTVAKRLKEAEQMFDEGSFDESIVVLEETLKVKTPTEKEKQAIYELLAANYLAKTYKQQADEALRRLLELVPNYKPDPQRYSPAFVSEVERVRQEMQQQAQQQQAKAAGEDQEGKLPPKKEAWYEQTWVWIVGGLVIVGGVVALVLAGGEDEEGTTPAATLPDPPPPPTR